MPLTNWFYIVDTDKGLMREVTDEDTKGQHGFTYVITNKRTGRFYLGKKALWFVRKVKGKKKRVRKSSDWRTYAGSCLELLEDIRKNPNDIWQRTILAFHETRGKMNYAEVRNQFMWDVLKDPQSYNSNINGKWFKETK